MSLFASCSLCAKSSRVISVAVSVCCCCGGGGGVGGVRDWMSDC